MTNKEILLDVDMLKGVLRYDAETGVFIWNKIASKYHQHLIGKIAGAETPRGYITIKINGISYRAHRLAFFYMTGKWPEVVDHINRNTSDNRWCNLRGCTFSENSKNCSKRENNKSGHKNVSWHKKSNSWRVQIRDKGKSLHIGCFDNLNDAVRAANDARQKYHAEFASC